MTVSSASERETTLSAYLDDISRFPVLTRAEELTLIPAARAGDQEAFEKMVRSNLRFVVRIAGEYEQRGMALADLISEGNLGLIRALETFDVERGIRFITYAKWWIRQNVVYALIYKAHLIRLPQSQLRKFNRAKTAIEQLERSLQRKPTEAEINKNLCSEYNMFASSSVFPIADISLTQKLNNEVDGCLLDFIANKDAQQPDKALDPESLEADLSALFSKLKEREADIISKLYGLETGAGLTLGEVGEEYGISRERVRQIKNEALEKLRAMDEVEQLRSYLD